jgi:lysophospholipase L1-like esterase
MTLFEHGVCLGDSLTSGARSRYGLAEGLAHRLNGVTNKRWLFRSEAMNGDTVLQLLRRMDQKPGLWKDATFCTILIGTNDAKGSVNTPPGIFQMLYGQLLDRLVVAKLITFPALIPDLQMGASLASPYDSKCAERIVRFNELIRAECAARGMTDALVETGALPPSAFADGVHFTEAGVDELARRFAEKITGR